ncbi:MAG: SRPBCC family protein, partial [Myxococcota bacterium]
EAFELFTRPQHLKSWFGQHVSLDAEPGGNFREVRSSGGELLMTTGTVVLLQPGRCVSWSWQEPGWPGETAVRVEFGDLNQGTCVQLTHSGWEGLKNAEELRECRRAAWGMHLDSLSRYVRDRPMERATPYV